MRRSISACYSRSERPRETAADSGVRRILVRGVNRAALIGKHDTLVRRAPGWQGAPDGQQAKKISCYKMFILRNKRFDMTS